MCNSCFDKEIKAFESEKEWLEFDFALTQKLSENKMKFMMLKANGGYIYNCTNCHESWHLKDPDHAFRGYFLRA
jgi:hypothetical protein